MCTRALWADANGAVLVGRNMDFGTDTQTNLWAFPRGMERDNTVDDSLSWTSKYGSVVAGGFDVSTNDGLNEAGFAAHTLWLTEADYGERDETRPALGMAVWMQYFLDNFATVAEAVAWLEESHVQVVTAEDPSNPGRAVTQHVALEDATGDSAILEYLGGEMHIWHGREHTVMTNSPPYDEQLERLQEIEGFGGDQRLRARGGRARRSRRAPPSARLSVTARARPGRCRRSRSASAAGRPAWECAA